MDQGNIVERVIDAPNHFSGFVASRNYTICNLRSGVRIQDHLHRFTRLPTSTVVGCVHHTVVLHIVCLWCRKLIRALHCTVVQCTMYDIHRTIVPVRVLHSYDTAVTGTFTDCPTSVGYGRVQLYGVRGCPNSVGYQLYTAGLYGQEDPEYLLMCTVYYYSVLFRYRYVGTR